ncbi:hypothetical protein D187_009617 [Cystobacter fuscus DSM 2262]|uniref:Uncharacterized protein n=1 Tax=Cystobacter fuscus (strain ATCC 25194 / DSM 2262 / NBRC 100088 / M29) TaxID=1242864 RepID=S9NW37_CYSF2|nr:hypothetical protein D187_009617 [Cystobacter fuscus DSM 2262]
MVHSPSVKDAFASAGSGVSSVMPRLVATPRRLTACDAHLFL